MTKRLSASGILKKTLEVGGLTALSRLTAIVRELLLIDFLGISGMSDAFRVAFKIPNMLRKIFAEGALSAALVPEVVSMAKHKSSEVIDRFMGATFLFFESVIAVLSMLVLVIAPYMIRVLAPGFPPETIAQAASYLKILFPFIFCISGSAIIAARLQSINHFFVPASAQIVQNVGWVIALGTCLWLGLSAKALCVGVLLSGVAHFLYHYIAYRSFGFRFLLPDSDAIARLKKTLVRFGTCLFGIGIIEVNLYLDMMIASYLPAGSITILDSAGKFMRLPLGIFAVALSTILLSQFSRIASYAPKRLQFYVHEATKFIIFGMVPTTLFCFVIAEKLFSTIIFRNNATLLQIHQVTGAFMFLIAGLVFFSLNKVLLTVFYALKDTKTPTIAAVVGTMINVAINLLSVLYLGKWAIYGIAGATSLGAIVLTLLCFIALREKYKFALYPRQLRKFIQNFAVQLTVAAALFATLFGGAYFLIIGTYLEHFFFETWGYWLLMLPIGGIIMLFLLLSRKRFSVHLHFIT